MRKNKVSFVSPNAFGKKISPLVFKEIRCAATSEERLEFDTSWSYETSVVSSNSVVSKEEVPTEVDLIDLDTLL